MKIFRNDLKLSSAPTIPSQGSQNVKLYLIEDDDDYSSYAKEVVVSYAYNEEETILSKKDGYYILPLAVFKEYGTIGIAVKMLKDDEIVVTKTLSLRIDKAPTTTELVPLEESWETIVKNYVDSIIGFNVETLDKKIDSTKDELQKNIDTKVDKIVGKSLSTNDYTNTDKSKVDNIANDIKTAKDEVINELNDKVDKLENTIPKADVEGSDIVIEDGIDYRLFDLKVEGNSIQDGTPTPDTPIEIKSVTGDLVISNNIFDKDSYEIMNIYPNNNSPYNSAATSVCVKVKPNTSYRINRLETTTFEMVVSSFELHPVAGMTPNNYILKEGTNTLVYDTQSNDNYLLIYVNWGSLNTLNCIKNLKVKTEFTMPLGDKELCKIENIADKLSIDMKTGVVNRLPYISDFDLDGSENWAIDNYGDFNYFTIRKSINGQSSGFLMSKYFLNQSAIIWLKNYNIGWGSGSLFIRYDEITTVEEFKTWLSTHNTKVKYILATPSEPEYITTLSSEDLEKLKTFTGYNNFTTNSELNPVMKIKYGQDLKAYINNQILDLSAVLVDTASMQLLDE